MLVYLSHIYNDICVYTYVYIDISKQLSQHGYWFVSERLGIFGTVKL